MYWPKVSASTVRVTPYADFECSLAWIEMRTIVAKVIYAHDLEWLNPSMDWHRDSQMHIAWHKPQLIVKVIPQKVT
jgi:hypothetical protein